MTRLVFKYIFNVSNLDSDYFHKVCEWVINGTNMILQLGPNVSARAWIVIFVLLACSDRR